MQYLTPVILTVVIAAIASVMLALAAKFFAVRESETAIAIRDCLSGANCGACGYAGCDDYAKALAADPTIPSNLCVPGGDQAASKVAAILGQEAMDVIEKAAVVHCSGICDVTRPVMEYEGLQTCAGAKGFFGGPGSCKFGCIGLGDCEKACPYGAIQVCEGVAKVDRDICVGCGVCVKTCPQHIIELIPLKDRVVTGCSSLDKGKATKDVCDVGCIACKICEKTCPFDAIHVIDNHAVIDYDKCRVCGKCAKACPRHIIHVMPKSAKAKVNPDAPTPQIKEVEYEIDNEKTEKN